MRTLDLKGKQQKNGKYHSYRGEVGKVADNLLNREFHAKKPFEKLATRYLSHEEQNFATQNIERAAIWCAKETLYKLANERGLDLRADIQISALDLGEGRITGRIKEGEPIIMHIMQPDKEHIAVYHI